MSGNHRSNVNYSRRPLNSNEELTQKISHSIFVTNFPDSVNSRDLWRECSVYGTVVDVFIPSKKSKAGKRFAFVRFIKVFNLDRLVKNLCTLWIGRYHLFANQVRFDRPHKPSSKKSYFPPLNGTIRVPGHGDNSLGPKQNNGFAGSYVSAVNWASPPVYPGSLISPSPALVLDDACTIERDFSKCAMGRVKDFNSISNLQTILADEGFEDVKLFYLGGLWVMLEFDKVDTKANLMKHIGVNSWFQVIQEVIQDFVSDERVVWVDIEGVPLYAWSRETFSRIGKKWGEMLNIEDSYDSSFGRKRVCIITKHPVSILESFKIIAKGKVFMVRVKELFTWNPTFVSHKEKVYSSDDDSVRGEEFKEMRSHLNDEEGGEFITSDVESVADTILGDNSASSKKYSENMVEIQDLSPSLSHPPGFTLVGYDKPNVNDHVIGEEVSQRNKEFSLMISAKVMNNSQLVLKEVSGNSVGGSEDVEDIPNKAKILIVAIYAPQQPMFRRVLWDYMSILLSRWNGEAILMGDFNEIIVYNTRAQQKALDDELVAPANRLKIGKSNLRLSSNIKSKEPTIQMVLDALKLTAILQSHLRSLLGSDTLNVEQFSEVIAQIFPQTTGLIFEEPHRRGVSIFVLETWDTLVYDVILPQHLTNQAMLESEAYKTYLAYATGEKIPKPKYVKNKVDYESSPKRRLILLLKARDSRLQQRRLNLPRRKAEQLKLMPTKKRSLIVNSVACLNTQISWKSSDEEDDDEVGLNEDDDEVGLNDDDDNDDDEDNDDADNQDDDDGQDDEDQDDVNEKTDSDNDGDDFVHPKLSTQDQEVRHNEKESDEEIQGANVEEEELDKEETNDEDKANELYRDVNVNLEGRDIKMTDAQQTNVQTTQTKNFGKQLLRVQANEQFAISVSSIPGIVDTYLANKMNEAVKTAVQLQSDRLKDES
ncbi:RNA-directed DNA polymerase, eukaryota [Tanacetum coccineum]